MTEQTKSFHELSHEENPHFLQDGKQIYGFLRWKYPNKTTKDLDNILNALSAAIVIHTLNNVHEDKFEYFIKLICNILEKNILEKNKVEK